MFDGFTVISPARLWCELAALLDVADLVAVGDFMIGRRTALTSQAELENAVDASRGTRGRARMLEALPLLDGGAESRPESILRVLLMRAGLSGVVANLPIMTPDGIRYRADLAFPGERLIMEYQGEYHFEPAQFRRDMSRRDRLEAAGWAVMLVNSDDLRMPGDIVARIRRRLHHR